MREKKKKNEILSQNAYKEKGLWYSIGIKLQVYLFSQKNISFGKGLHHLRLYNTLCMIYPASGVGIALAVFAGVQKEYCGRNHILKNRQGCVTLDWVFHLEDMG